jgi:hypothetical protein
LGKQIIALRHPSGGDGCGEQSGPLAGSPLAAGEQRAGSLPVHGLIAAAILAHPLLAAGMCGRRRHAITIPRPL